MTTFVLSAFDVVGIQEYIFSSRKLKEQMGASILVAQALEDFLPRALQEATGNAAVVNWAEQPHTDTFSFDQVAQHHAVVIYIGGGNALVLFRDQDTAVAATCAFSDELARRTGGGLHVATASLPLQAGDDFGARRTELMRALGQAKGRLIRAAPVLGLAITRECESDGLPASRIDNREYLSEAAWQKRQALKGYQEQRVFEKHLLPKESPWSFPTEFDDMVPAVQERPHLAVVHIDGNDMGRFILSQIRDPLDFERSVVRSRRISLAISSLYRSVFGKLLEELIRLLEAPDTTYPPPAANRLPLRPIIANGDDITFVCEGTLGLALAARFLELLEGMPLQVQSPGPAAASAPPHVCSACAGVAVVKPHFPFHHAYQLAEDLCASAKRRARSLAKEGRSASWLDAHLQQGGVLTPLDVKRARTYSVPGKPPPAMEGPPGHLLWRPWCVVGEHTGSALLNWSHFKDLHRSWAAADGSGWPRSRLKDLREQFGASEAALESAVARHRSRGYTLPPFEGVREPWVEGRTPYFDAIEWMDQFVDLPLKQEVVHAPQT